MSKKFKHLNLSPHWQQYFSKYPQGYTIIENLIDWVSQVDNMVDNQNELNETVETYGNRLDEFIGQYDTHLQETVEQTLSDWQTSGFLNMIINETLDTKYHKMDNRLTAQLLQKVNHGENESITKDMLAQDIKEDLNNGEIEFKLNTSEIEDGAITGEKVSGVTKTSRTRNLYDKNDVTQGYYLNTENGELVSGSNWAISGFIPVEKDKLYKKNVGGSVGFYDSNKNFIRGISPTKDFTTGLNDYFIRISISIDSVDTVLLSKAGEWSEEYVDYLPKYVFTDTWDIPNNSITGLKLMNVFKTSKTRNLFDKNDIQERGYLNENTGEWINSVNFVASNYIAVEPNTHYHKNIGGNVTYFDENFNFMRGVAPTQEFYVDDSVFFIRLSFPANQIEDMMLSKKSEWVDEYVPFEQGYILGDAWRMRRGVSDKNTGVSKDLFLRVPTPYDDGRGDSWSTHQTTHPSVAQFETAWHGYKYWMVHTPYPYSNDLLENPCIVVSNNGVEWEEPNGINNPLALPPTDNDHLSDGHIFYNDSTDRLEMWYRETIRSTLRQENFKRRTSSDGVNWSEVETMLSHTSPESDPNGSYRLSPSIIYNEGMYKLWFTNDTFLFYIESEDGKNWSEPIQAYNGGESTRNWHATVVLHDNQYHLFVLARGVQRIEYATAEVGSETSFSALEMIIESSGNEWELDGKWLYRATPLWLDNSVMVIYGTVSQENVWLLHAQTGKDFTRLKPLSPRAFDYYNIQ